jgi:hypothetical protein
MPLAQRFPALVYKEEKAMSQKIGTTFSILILVLLFIALLSVLTALPAPAPRSSNNYALPMIVYQESQMNPHQARFDPSPTQNQQSGPEALISLAAFAE